jgi:hypothetical protein
MEVLGVPLSTHIRKKYEWFYSYFNYSTWQVDG